MRTVIPSRLLRKVRLVRPRPWRMLFRVAFRYKKGQIQARVCIKSPASVLSKKNVPRRWPVSKKKIVQNEPKGRQKPMAFFRVERMRFRSPAAADSETEGRRSTETEPVRTVGNKIKERDIPVKVP